MPVHHGRAEWLRYSANGMSGPAQDRLAVRGIVLHYTGGNTSFDGTDENFARFLARLNDQYWNDPNRGYALGYNWGCEPDGDLWDIRATDIRCAANGCQLVNVPWVAILVPTRTITTPPTAAQDDALKNIWVPKLRGFYPNAQVHVVGHRDIRKLCADGGSTACPGDPIYSRIQAGFYDRPGESPLPQPTPTGDDEVAILLRSTDGDAVRQNTVFITNGVSISPFAFDIDMVSLLALKGVLTVDAPASTDPLRSYRRPAAEIQNLINNGWAGPRTSPNIGGYVIPPDPAVVPIADVKKTVVDGDTAQNKILSDAFAAVDVDLSRMEEKIDLIPTTPGGGTGGLTEAQMAALLERTKVQLAPVSLDVTP